MWCPISFYTTHGTSAYVCYDVLILPVTRNVITTLLWHASFFARLCHACVCVWERLPEERVSRHLHGFRQQHPMVIQWLHREGTDNGTLPQTPDFWTFLVQ